MGGKLLHVFEKWFLKNVFVKFPKTLGKHIPLNIGEREEKKDENQIRKHVRKASVTFS